ncbi:NRDE family protein [Salinicola sp. JS01]|uniref:NRDE family protein n=1 Tax=Salinicola sp. JS01 TaxID=3050071 RepID=UPI00255BE584|nr:NRDE family protein [Salinicola sp. JS01]WIX33850.1 NRDE family protein [Salinicola sp. JS01]
MCLIVFDWQPDSDRPLRLAANRDEFHARPSAALHRWQDAPLLGGRDLEGGGTWLAATRGGRFAALTNVRDAHMATPADAPSRGELVTAALQAAEPQRWLQDLASAGAQRYAGFNLLLREGDRLWVLHHGRDATTLDEVAPGLHGLSNAALNTPWPKLVRAREALRQALDGDDWQASIWQAMHDTRPVADAELPDTGVGLATERRLSAIFIVGETYGTRATTLVSAAANGVIEITERRYAGMGVPEGECVSESVSA